MITYFNKTAKGFAHNKTNKPCQDHSMTYHDFYRTIITACDGHGGDLYIRSDRGSLFASEAIMRVMMEFSRGMFYKYSKNELKEKIKLRILCEWNNLVENDLKENHIRKNELLGLTEKDILTLRSNPVKAYGTTLCGAMVFGNKVLCVGIGDSCCFFTKKGNLIPVFEEDEENVANITYSMCAEDAYNHMDVVMTDFSSIDGIFLCTDGVINPYSNLNNFNESFIKPVTLKLHNGEAKFVDDYIVKLGSELGTGDDVSLSVILRDKFMISRYKSEGEK